MIDPGRPDYEDTPASARRPGRRYVPGSHQEPLVSIVTPFFNTGPVFDETVVCVRSQSLQDWEWVIVNDGSTDPASLALLDECSRVDGRIRVIHTPERRGPGAARNVGAAAARARYLLLLDSDDLIEPTAAEKWWWCLESYEEFGFVKGFSVGFGAMEYLASSGFHEEAAFLERNRVDITSLIRSEVFAQAGGFPEGNAEGLEDWEFWLRCASAGVWGGTVPEYLSWYRRRADDAARWRNWQGDGGSPALRARLRKEFARLYEDPKRFPSPRPTQVRHSNASLPRHLVRRSAEREGGSGAGATAGDSGFGIRGDRTGAALVASATLPERLETDGPVLLMLVPWLTVGGADKFNLDLAGGLVERGWQVSIATTLQGDDRWLSRFAHVTPDVFCMPNFLRLTDYPPFIEHLIESRRVEAVLIANSELAYRLLPHLKRRFPGVAFVDFSHMEQEEWLDGGYPRMSIDAAPWLDATVALSDHLREWMTARGRSGETVTVSHLGVDVPTAEEVARARERQRRAWGVQNEPVLLFAGRVVPQKRPALFGEVASRLFAAGLRFSVVVAGDGPELPQLREQLQRSGSGDRVRFLGAVSPVAMHEILCASDVLCLPSAWEGMALVLHEAMARAVAVVAADVGGQRELVTPDCGVLISAASRGDLVDEYTSAAAALLRDGDRRRRIGAAARTRIATHFRLEQMTGRMEGVLLDAVQRVERRPAASPALPRSSQRASVLDPASDTAEAVTLALASQYQPYHAWVRAVAAGGPVPISINARAFRRLTVLEPIYRWGLRRGWHWLPALRQRLRAPVRRLLGLDR